MPSQPNEPDQAPEATTPTPTPDTPASPIRPTIIWRDPNKPVFIEGVEIELEPGVTRMLVMDFEMMNLIEKEMGIVLWKDEGWGKVTQDHHSIAEFLTLVFKRDEPDMTVEKVQRMKGFRLANIQYITNRLDELWGLTMPPEKEAEEDGDAEPEVAPDPNASPRSRSRSTTSTATPASS